MIKIPIDYKYEGKDKNGKKKFSKKYRSQKWVGDYDNGYVRNYENYLSEALKNKLITEEEIEYIAYFEGNFENACKFFNLPGESCKVFDKKTKENIIKEDKESREIKVERLVKLIKKHQFNQAYISKTSAELFELLTLEMRNQYYYVSPEFREGIALEAIRESEEFVRNIDMIFLNKELEDQSLIDSGMDEFIRKTNNSFRKRLNKLKYFYSKIKDIWSN